MNHFNYVQFFTTILLFYIEALIHYNIGRKGTIGIRIPSWKKNRMILGVIVIFSLVSCVLTNIVSELITI